MMDRELLVSPLDSEGERNIYRMGESLGFNLLNSFSGDNYVFFGRFASLRPESTIWRLRKLNAVLSGRRAAIPARVAEGLVSREQADLIERLFQTLRILVIVTGDTDKHGIIEQLKAHPLDYQIEILTVTEVLHEVGEAIPGYT